MTRLSVLQATDLPETELSAALLDGELFRVAGAYLPIDSVGSPAQRASAALTGRSPRLIAERLTAAWIWGALIDPPEPHTFCVSLHERARPAPDADYRLREVAIGHGDVATLGGRRVTTSRRTLIDLSRSAEPFPAGVALTLCRLGEVDPLELARSLAERDRLPARKRAVSRLTALGRAA